MLDKTSIERRCTISSTYDGTLVYTKGTIRKTQDVEEYYLLISAKKDAV